MRALLLIPCAAVALSACSGNNSATNNDMTDMNATATDNMMVDQNAMAGGIDGNAATNGATENMMMNDLTHNDADTNLANGM